ncbi:hypothetical protein [Coraliomargarita akajimensis]|uniref:Uncharacterized protein n=1 Tax=Coraliomargarita akajimensis (strain DSM 45221 / IAM 15411 / JCM 23193 / KCTC 12865 / 04OKA010-24) TaxID=583355 RepID=D5EHN6_CORAD|nr:hypothetical protein [Coraliomargarita akajimensis]ADE54077.1 hypothetical protein Caka_1055 [Coraliomargarita akajimensis DSM 45221]
MSETETDANILSPQEQLSARWDKVAFRAQGSPFEDLSVACLAKNSGTRAWSRPGVKGDTLARYAYFSFEELLEIEKLDLRLATQLLEICEVTLLFEEECDDLGSFQEIDNQAHAQRMRFVEEFGLYQDYPVKLANLNHELRELCGAEDVKTFIELMEFLDRLADKAWIGGSYKCLQNVFAHGDENGLTEHFPYRLGHRGFHLPEALSFCLNRLKRRELQEVHEYYERRRKRGRLMSKPPQLPAVVEDQLLPEILECLHYFGRRQPRLLIRLHDSVFLCRELMNLNDPQTEGVLHWLIHLALGIFRPSANKDVGEDLKQLSKPMDEEICSDLRKLVNDDSSH